MKKDFEREEEAEVERELSELQRGGLGEDLDLTVESCEIEKEEEEDEEKNRGIQSDEAGEENVKVMVRCRPLSEAEKKKQNATGGDSIKLFQDDKCVQIDERQFHFDAVFGPDCDNEFVYMKAMRRLVESAFKGYNCTAFLYGQTGTGKTFTHSSLTLNSFAHLFSFIGDSNDKARFLIRASYYELYNEDIRDLLSASNKPLDLRESKQRGVYVKDLSNYLVNNLAELEKLKKLGDKRRTVAATKMNEHSSRSHSIFTITIEFTQDDKDRKTSATSTTSTSSISSKKRTPSSSARLINSANKQHRTQSALSTSSTSSISLAQPVRVGRLHLIDLAGSERQAKSGSSGARLKEASKINLSLTCLSLVIRALTDKNSNHVPYRNSKLTRLLSGSLGGNSKTLLIACISPALINLEETLNTLRFASRTKKIKNKAIINEDAKDALLRKYRKQIEELRLKLKEHQQQQQQRTINTTSIKDEDETIDSLIANHETNKEHVSLEDNNLLAQLRMLKGKIIVGGENLLEKVEMHERLIEANRLEIEEKHREELKLKEKLEKKYKIIDKVTKTKGSLESQVIELDERLKRVLLLYKRTKEEYKDLNSEHHQLKDNLLQSIRATSKEIKYANCIIENFIPRDQLDLINTYAQYDEESDEWQIKYIALSGNNIAHTRRLTEASDTPEVSSFLLTGSFEENNESSRKRTTRPKKFNTSRTEPYIRLTRSDSEKYVGRLP